MILKQQRSLCCTLPGRQQIENACLVTVFAWEAYEKGSEVHLQADPTKLELLHKSFKVKKEEFKETQRGGILEKVHTCPLFKSF